MYATKENIRAVNARLAKLGAKVDQLGVLNAAISKLQAEAEAIKGTLKASGFDEVAGMSYRAVIVAKDSCRLDNKKVKALLSPMEIISCTVVSRSTSVCLYDL